MTPFRNPRVLIVEDDPDQSRALLYGLGREGFLPSAVENAHAALLKLRLELFDVVLCDLNLPGGMRGDEFLRRLRSEHPAVAFVMYTGDGHDVPTAVRATLEQGADGYLVKPSTIAAISTHLVSAIHRRGRELERDRQVRMAEKGQFEAVYRTQRVLVRAMETKDMYTRRHSAKVTLCTMIMARTMGLDRPRMRVLKAAAMLHDIGKIAVPLTILHKEGSLNDAEWEIIKKHTVDGAHIVNPMKKFMPEIESIVRHEHERWDGRGYPDGLAGLAIPLGSRLIMFADTYDAICSDRSYRRAQSPEVALRAIQEGAGSQFDPELVPVFEECYRSFPRPTLGLELEA